jgi:hypothetical protein
VQGFLDGLTGLNSTAKPRPAARMGNSRFVVAVVHEQPIVCHDEQHRRPAPGWTSDFRHAAQA